MSRQAVHRIWKAFGLQPHRSETFKLSTDPQLIEKVRDMPPAAAAPEVGSATVTRTVSIVAVDRARGDRAQLECHTRSSVFSSDVMSIDVSDFRDVAQVCIDKPLGVGSWLGRSRLETAKRACKRRVSAMTVARARPPGAAG
jgi:hypothetical protein